MRDRVDQDELDYDTGAGQWEPMPDDWDRYEENQGDITGAQAMSLLERLEWSGEFLKGQSDCVAGKPHSSGTDGYNSGYAAQYAWEQTKTEQTK